MGKPLTRLNRAMGRHVRHKAPTISAQPQPAPPPAAPARDFMTAALERAQQLHVPLYEAMSQLAREEPELHRAYMATLGKLADQQQEARLLRSEHAGLRRRQQQ